MSNGFRTIDRRAVAMIKEGIRANPGMKPSELTRLMKAAGDRYELKACLICVDYVKLDDRWTNGTTTRNNLHQVCGDQFGVAT